MTNAYFPWRLTDSVMSMSVSGWLMQVGDADKHLWEPQLVGYPVPFRLYKSSSFPCLQRSVSSNYTWRSLFLKSCATFSLVSWLQADFNNKLKSQKVGCFVLNIEITSKYLAKSSKSLHVPTVRFVDEENTEKSVQESSRTLHQLPLTSIFVSYLLDHLHQQKTISSVWTRL